MLPVEDTQLTETGHPVLRMPGSNDLPVFDFVNIDNLDAHGPVLRRKSHERFSLRACHCGADDHLVSALEDVLYPEVQVGKGRCQLGEKRFCASWTGRLTGRRRNVDPVLAQDSVEKRWVLPGEGLVPEHDYLLVVVHISLRVGTPVLRLSRRTQE